MLDKLRSLLTLNKKEVRQNAGSAFIAPVLKSIKKDVMEIEISLNNIQRLIDVGFKIGFDKIPAAFLTDLIEKTQEFSALIEASNVQNRIKLTELVAKMNDNTVKCSGMVTFLVNSNDPDLDMRKSIEFFGDVKNNLAEVCQLV